jgi:hypothetical protein
MPITFPSLICSIILDQHPNILTSADEACKRESPLTFHSKLFEGKHAADIDIAGPSSKAAPTSMSRKDMIASLEASCKALEEKKQSLEQMILALRQEEVAEEGDQAHVDEEGGDSSDDDGDTEELDLSDDSAAF